MRDTDIDFKSVFITKAKNGIKSIQDLKGKKFGLGSADSAQAAILPLKYLQNELAFIAAKDAISTNDIFLV